MYYVIVYPLVTKQQHKTTSLHELRINVNIPVAVFAHSTLLITQTLVILRIFASLS